MRRPQRAKVNPKDVDAFLDNPELQELVASGQAYEREKKEAEKTFRASFRQGLSAQALSLILPALSDQASARKI